MAERGTRASSPALGTLKVIGGDEHLLAIEKSNIDQLPIRCRSARSEAVEAVFVFQRSAQDRFRPNDPARFPIQAKQKTLLGFHYRAYGKNEISLDDHGSMSKAG